eukprot:3305468-Amphidinium_carterae.1
MYRHVKYGTFHPEAPHSTRGSQVTEFRSKGVVPPTPLAEFQSVTPCGWGLTGGSRWQGSELYEKMLRESRTVWNCFADGEFVDLGLRVLGKGRGAGFV